MHPVKLVGRAAGTATHTIRHPVASVAYAAGMARGLVGAVIAGVTREGDHPEPDTRPADSAVPTTPTTRPRPQRVPKPVPDPADLPEPVLIEPAVEEVGEAFATEPKAVSRDSAHGAAAGVDAEVDEWEDEARRGLDAATDIDIETPVGTTGAEVGHNPDTAEADLQQPGTEPLLDPGTAKAIRAESEILQKAADHDKG